MPLLNQFQAFIGSMLFGALLLFSWSAFNRLFYHCKSFFVRLIFEVVFFLISTLFYFSFLCFYTDGVLNIFYILGIFLGALIYYRFYAQHFNRVFESVAKVIEKEIIIPAKLKKQKVIAIIKQKKNRKEKRNEKESIDKNQSNH